MDKENNSSQNMKNMIAFIPLFGIVFYFLDNDKTEVFTRNARYAIILLVAYIVLSIIFIFLLYGILVLAYFCMSIYLWYMAYNGNDVQISVFDSIIESFLKDKE